MSCETFARSKTTFCDPLSPKVVDDRVETDSVFRSCVAVERFLALCERVVIRVVVGNAFAVNLGVDFHWVACMWPGCGRLDPEQAWVGKAIYRLQTYEQAEHGPTGSLRLCFVRRRRLVLSLVRCRAVLLGESPVR